MSVPSAISLKYLLLEDLGGFFMPRHECKERLHAFLKALNAFKTCRHAVSDVDLCRSGLKTGCLPKCKAACGTLSLQLQMDSLQLHSNHKSEADGMLDNMFCWLVHSIVASAASQSLLAANLRHAAL